MPSRSGVKNPWVGTIWPHSKKVSFLYFFCTFNYGALTKYIAIMYTVNFLAFLNCEIHLQIDKI